jgi:hypothetical protein
LNEYSLVVRLPALLLMACVGIVPAAAADLVVAIAPARPIIEYRQHEKIVNFDILVVNRSTTAYRLVAVRLEVFGRDGLIEVSRQLNGNGRPAALQTIGSLRLGPGETADYFQPFERFSDQVDLHRMHIELLFMAGDRTASPIPFDADVQLETDVMPRSLHPAPFCLPLIGRVLVQDGHDLYSHHRRHGNGIAVSPNLFAYDLVRVDDQGRYVRGDRMRLPNWLTYGQAVRAPAAGVVAAARGDIPDNQLAADGTVIAPENADKIDPEGLGNYVVIRHPDGRYSWMLHLQPGFVTVKAGQHVRAGQQLGTVGFGGDSLFPHLHYMVTNGARYPSQGVPSYFRNLAHLLGRRRVMEAITQIDTGDIVADRGGPCQAGAP